MEALRGERHGLCPIGTHSEWGWGRCISSWFKFNLVPVTHDFWTGSRRKDRGVGECGIKWACQMMRLCHGRTRRGPMRARASRWGRTQSLLDIEMFQAPGVLNGKGEGWSWKVDWGQITKTPHWVPDTSYLLPSLSKFIHCQCPGDLGTVFCFSSWWRQVNEYYVPPFPRYQAWE